ncbi:Fic family protein [Prosthecobacter sp.]|uniref:Fic family protein n=1 Tax=Prosthecobacter sp. TaxID=1965333 RepID=UPI0037850B69
MCAATGQVTDQVKALLKGMGTKPVSALECMKKLGLSHRPTFRQNYLQPAVDAGLIERTLPDKPNSRLQKYRRREV